MTRSTVYSTTPAKCRGQGRQKTKTPKRPFSHKGILHLCPCVVHTTFTSIHMDHDPPLVPVIGTELEPLAFFFFFFWLRLHDLGRIVSMLVYLVPR